LRSKSSENNYIKKERNLRSFFIGTTKGINTPGLASKLKIRFQAMSHGLALR